MLGALCGTDINWYGAQQGRIDARIADASY